VPSVCGPEDDLIDRLSIDNIPVNSLCAFEDLSDDGTVAGIGEGRQPGVAAEVVEGCQYRVAVPFRCLSMVLRHGKEKAQDLLLGDAGEVTLTKSPSKSAEHELTCLDGIFFSSWLCGTADGNRPLGKHSCCTSCGWGSMSDMLTLGVYTMMQTGYRKTLPAQEISLTLTFVLEVTVAIGNLLVVCVKFSKISSDSPKISTLK